MSDQYETFTGDQDETRIRVYKKNGHEFIIKSEGDPYGMWVVERPSGTIPFSMAGRYTTIEYAKQAIDAYVNERPFKVDLRKEIKVKPKKTAKETETVATVVSQKDNG